MKLPLTSAKSDTSGLLTAVDKVAKLIDSLRQENAQLRAKLAKLTGPAPDVTAARAKGGRARAKLLTKAQRSAIARKGAQTRWANARA